MKTLWFYAIATTLLPSAAGCSGEPDCSTLLDLSPKSQTGITREEVCGGPDVVINHKPRGSRALLVLDDTFAPPYVVVLQGGGVSRRALVLSSKACEGKRLTTDWYMPYEQPAQCVDLPTERVCDTLCTVRDRYDEPFRAEVSLPFADDRSNAGDVAVAVAVTVESTAGKVLAVRDVEVTLEAQPDGRGGYAHIGETAVSFAAP